MVIQVSYKSLNIIPVYPNPYNCLLFIYKALSNAAMLILQTIQFVRLAVSTVTRARSWVWPVWPCQHLTMDLDPGVCPEHLSSADQTLIHSRTGCWVWTSLSRWADLWPGPDLSTQMQFLIARYALSTSMQGVHKMFPFCRESLINTQFQTIWIV